MKPTKKTMNNLLTLSYDPESYPLWRIYHDELPEFLLKAANSRSMLRLKNIGMNCGCEYTSFPRFVGLKPYSRFAHSVGVAQIIWHFTGDTQQSLAGLFHDISTPVFAHVIDFLRGDYLTQEATEEGTKDFIDSDPTIQELLKECNLSTYDVCDYHRFPIADNDSPRLSADRLEYTIGNLLNYRILPIEELKELYESIIVCNNEDGDPELGFSDKEIALKFGLSAIQCSEIYVSDEDRFSMQILSELIAEAIQAGVLEEIDLYTEEKSVILKLTANETSGSKWKAYQRMHEMIRCDRPDENPRWRKIPAKKRYIDPLIKEGGRLSALDRQFRERMTDFRDRSLDYWIRSN